MNKTICFFGHRNLIITQDKIAKKLSAEIKKWINKGYYNFLIGTHGEFDHIVFSVCKKLKSTFSCINITLVLTSLTRLKECNYKDINTLIYPIEEEHFKQRIKISNQMMINDSDVVICYVDQDKKTSGAKSAMNYAAKHNKIVINLFNNIDNPIYGKNRECLNIEFQKYLDNTNKILKRT